MKNFKFDSKTNCYYTYVPTGCKNPNGTTEHKKIRAKSVKNLEDRINRKGDNK